MKKIVFITGITVAVILLAMGCSNPTSSSSESLDSGNLGTDPLTLSGTIYNEVNPSPPDYTYSYDPITANGTLTASTNGTSPVTIEDGSFTIEVAVPTSSLAPVTPAMGNLDDDWDNVTVTGSANGADLSFTISGAIGNGNLKRQRTQVSVGETSYSGTYQMVQYFYVDADVTVTGDEATDSSGGTTTVYKAFTLNLQEGWNAVYMRSDFTVTMSTDEETVTLSVGIPGGLYWVLD
jgi:hypothetical protein